MGAIKTDGSTTRFYRNVDIVKGEDGYAITIGKRLVDTPKNNPLIVPSKRLAQAIAFEFDTQTQYIKPSSMPLLQLTLSSIDVVRNDKEKFIRLFRPYIQMEGTCLRATEPPGLVKLQDKHWQPLVEWVEREYNWKFNQGIGIMAPQQPIETLELIDECLRKENEYTLAALESIVHVAKSFVVGWAVVKRRVSLDEAFACARLEENWQISQHGKVDGIYGHTTDIEYARTRIAASRTLLNLLEMDGIK